MSRSREPARPRKVDGFWYLVRRVPAEFAQLDRRKVAMLSTRVRVADDPRCVRANRIVQRLDAELQLYWSSLKNGADPLAMKRWEWARETARRFGFDYVEGAILQDHLGELLKRLEALQPLSDEARREVRPALLGEVKPPKAGTLVDDMLKQYEAIVAASLLTKSPRQLERWRTTRQRALNVFVKIVGKGKLVHALSHDDTYALRDCWNKRVLAGEVQVDTANKQIGYVAAMFREIRDHERLKIEDIFQRKFIKGGEQKQRAAFDIEHVQNVLLAPGAMDKLNDEARAIFYIVAELGLRPSEVCGLNERTIHLDTDVPYVEIKPDGRQLKTRNSERAVPLLGIALEVMKSFPNGFPKYRDRNDTLSATINKHLVTNRLLQRHGQTFYSLRHTFKDRLRRTTAKDELIDMLMGHGTGKEKYGLGYELQLKLDVLKQIAFTAPPLSFAQQDEAHDHERRPLREHQPQIPKRETATSGRPRRKATPRPSPTLAGDVHA